MGPFCWRVAKPRHFREPIPAKGQLNLYSLPEDLARLVAEPMRQVVKPNPSESEAAWASDLAKQDSELDRSIALYSSYVQLGDGNNALRLAERGLALRPDADAYVNRSVAKALLQPAPDRGALTDANSALESDPQNGRAFHVRGLIYRELGRSREAKADLAKAKKFGYVA